MPSFDPNDYIISENDAQKMAEDFISTFGNPDSTNALSNFVIFPKELLLAIATDYDKEEVTHFKINFGCSEVEIGENQVTKLNIFISAATTDAQTGEIVDLPSTSFNRYNRGQVCPPTCF